MTDMETRHEIVATVSNVWTDHPEMRFCQLVQFIAGMTDPFYMEDREFLRKATELFKQG